MPATLYKKPIYYRFLFSPSSGDVTIAHNHEGHPANIRFHEDMERERPEKDLERGYAYRIGSDWHLTTHEHKHVVDPYARERILETLQAHD